MDANPFIEAYNTSAKAQYNQQYFMQHVRLFSLNVITLAPSLPSTKALLQALQGLAAAH